MPTASLLLLLLIAGCSGLGAPAASTKRASPTGSPCPQALLAGVLIEQDGEFAVDGDGDAATPATRVTWQPWEYRLVSQGERLVVVDVNDVVLARSGDRVRFGGSSNDAGFTVCGTFEVTPETATATEPAATEPGRSPLVKPTTEPQPTIGCGAQTVASRIALVCTGSPPGTPPPPPPPLTPRPTRSFESAQFLLTRVGDDVFLIDPHGMAVYTRDRDPSGESTCYGECSLRWPPVLLLDGETPKVEDRRFGTAGEIVRADGSRQVTVDGKPLYYYSGDTESLTMEGACERGWKVIAPHLVEGYGSLCE